MTPEKLFHDQVVIVTGASTGIGRETALAFAAAGARVVLAARNETQLRELAGSNPQFLVVPTDVTRDDDVRRLIETTIAKWGRVDILVNNAGFGMSVSLEQTKFADAARLMDVNFLGILRCTQAVLPHMKKQGHGQIVNVGSILSLIATPNNSIYSASKFAVRALSDAWRIELRDDNIDVILIMPGYTDTPFFDNQIRFTGPRRHATIKPQPPSEVAATILRACRKRQREVVLTLPAKLGACAKRFSPRFLDWCLYKLASKV